MKGVSAFVRIIFSGQTGIYIFLSAQPLILPNKGYELDKDFLLASSAGQ